MKKLVIAASNREYTRWKLSHRIPDGESVEVKTTQDIDRVDLAEHEVVLVGQFWLNTVMQHTVVRRVVAEEIRLKLVEYARRPRVGAAFVPCLEAWVGVRFVRVDDAMELWIGVVPFVPLRIWWRVRGG